MKSSAEFEAAYDRLNTEQKDAVDTIQGPVFVIAGPGTGKTQILTLRIANILRLTDTPPESILALTFTESAASTMRARLAGLIGATTAWKVRIHTFHGFAQSLIERFPDAFPRIVGSTVATNAERAEIMDAALLASDVTHLRPYGDPLYYHYAATRAIDTLKRENITPEKLRERLTQEEADFDALPGKIHEKGKYEGRMKGEFETTKKKLEKTRDLLTVYEAYEAGLTSRKRYDFADIILEAVRALTIDESLKRQVQEQLLYLLADEHQDANASQNALLELVSDYDDAPNLFIVGDEKQAIYRFQGADLDTMHYFRVHFRDTKIIALVENYRSTQTVLDVALSLISASPDERLSRVPLAANSAHVPEPIIVISCDTAAQEEAELVSRVQEALQSGVPAEEIAVFGRRNRDVTELRQALQQAGISTTSGDEGGVLQNRFVRALIRVLRAVAAPGDEQLAGILTLPAFPLSAADSWRVLSKAKQERVPVLSFMRDDTLLAAGGIQDMAAVHALAEHIEILARFASIERPAVVAEEALRTSGLLPKILAAPDRAESLSAVRAFLRLFEELSSREHDATLTRALALVDLHEERSISIGSDVTELPGRVKVMTVHKAKGREFECVFVPRMTNSAWSTRARAEHFYLPDILSGSAELEDERRLLYVAITRAKRSVTLSFALTRPDGREDAPMPLLEELAPELVSHSTSTLETNDPLERERAVDTTRTQASEDDLTTLRQAFLSQGLSPTALNNFLECPWKYFYVNLLRIPEAANKFMCYGTAIHAALYRYALSRNTGTDIGVDGLINSFLHSLTRSPLSEGELEELEGKGRKALNGWWDQRHEAWPLRVEAEIAIEATLLLEDQTPLLLRGKLDRVDTVGGGVRVIDYKTGKPKSRNDLMGATKTGTGDYYRQLTFYKLLLETADLPRTMQEGVIEFVEPDEKSRIRTEVFEITEAEVEELKTCIQRVATEILTLSFWNDPCSEVECSWCSLRFS